MYNKIHVHLYWSKYCQSLHWASVSPTLCKLDDFSQRLLCKINLLERRRPSQGIKEANVVYYKSKLINAPSWDNDFGTMAFWTTNKTEEREKIGKGRTEEWGGVRDTLVLSTMMSLILEARVEPLPYYNINTSNSRVHNESCFKSPWWNQVHIVIEIHCT